MFNISVCFVVCYRHRLRMVDTSKKSPCLDLSLYQGLHWFRCSVLTVMLVLLIGTGHEMCVNCSSMQEAKAVVNNFYSRYNVTSAVDLVFVLDRSGSVNRGGWRHMITFVRASNNIFSYDAFFMFSLLLFPW